MKHFAIIGAGGFAREVSNCLQQFLVYNNYNANEFSIDYIVEEAYYKEDTLSEKKVFRLSDYNFSGKQCLIAIGDSMIRSRIANSLADLDYFTLVHPSAWVGENVKLSKGTIVTQNVVLTCDISIGLHAHLNLNTTIGHDTIIQDFFTTAPGVNVSGNCKIGNNVYLGTQVSVRDRVEICSNVMVGMGGVVVKNISEPGTYVGVPVKKN